jgi:hypothetical protein
MIVFENRGEADVLALTTSGVSVKVGDSPIGRFGTGFNYALAVLLRDGCRVTVFSGLEKTVFSTRRANIRGTDFELVEASTDDGQWRTLGFTTQYGRDWAPWMAYRELYCNARDEGGEVYEAATESGLNDPRPGLTQIRVEGDSIADIHQERALYFLEDEPDLKLDGVNVYRRPSMTVFYRGVKVMDLPQPAALTYNFTRRMDLTEDRTLAHPFMVQYYLAQSLAKCTDRAILEEVLTPIKGSLEDTLDWRSHAAEATPVFLDTVSELKSSGARPVASAALTVLDVRRASAFVPQVARLDFDLRTVLDEAISSVDALDLSFKTSSTFEVAEEIPHGADFIVHDDTVWISQDALESHERAVAALIRGSLEISGTSNWEDALMSELIRVGGRVLA